jgi:L-ribulose-5-phosphate 3-epimerase
MGQLAVCSWSLRPQSPEDLCQRTRAAGLDAVQLALDPVRRSWGEARTAECLEAAGVRVVSGMMAMEGEDYSTLETIRTTGGVRPDRTWDANLHAAEENAALARRMHIRLVTFHAGFLPHDEADPERRTMLERLLMLRDVFAAEDVEIALETGQESAATLLRVLEELEGIGVNFDPANMILYGMGDPVEALRRLGPRVRQIHVKDAVPAARPGEWGTETVVGEGAVDWPAFFGAVRDAGLTAVNLVVEREGGEARVDDIAAAVRHIRRVLGERR